MIQTIEAGGPPAAGWWGDGLSPAARWPGSTIEIEAVWVPARGRWESPDGVFYFDTLEAARAVAFFPLYLRHHIGEFAGRAFELLEYQRLLLTAPIFGWKAAADGLRRFRKVFAFLPKGAGKSPWGAGVGLYLAFCDREPGAEVYAVASDKDQARIVHDNARIMVEGMQEIEPEFRSLFQVYRDVITCPDTRSKYEVLSSDASGKHGRRPHGVIFDEFHAQRNRDLFEALKKSMVKRRQPIMILITHAGHDDQGICFEEYEYSKGVLSGTIPDPACLPVIFEASRDDDWTSPAVWARVNPGHGVTVKAAGVAGECLEAQGEPRKLNDFLMFHLNRWVNQSTAWIPLDWWDRCDGAMESDAVLSALPVAAGLDLAQKIDLACLSVVFRVRLEVEADPITVTVVAGDEITTAAKKPVAVNYRIIVVPFFWIPEETMVERERADGTPYADYARLGLVTPTPGAIIDYDRIFADIGAIGARFPRLKEGGIGYDPAFATDLASHLRDHAGWKVAEVLQNYKYMSEPCYVLEALIKAGRVVHGGHRVLRQHLEAVSVRRDDAGRIRPVKPKRAGKHIDGVVSTLMALRMLAALPDVPPAKFQVLFPKGRP